MGLYNNFRGYNAEEETARRVKLLQILESEPTIVDWANENENENENKDGRIPTVKITKTSGGGSSYSVDCPNCGKTKILSNELNTMSAVCNGCYMSFKLER